MVDGEDGRERFEMKTTKNGIVTAPWRGATRSHESGTNRLCTTGGASSPQGVSKECRPLSRRLLPQEFLLLLIGIARPLYAHDPIGVDLDHTLYALDSTTIDLCLSLFPWARFRRHKAA